MDSIKYIGLDVHQSTISVAVLNADGKLVMQSVIATHAATILDFLHGLRGTLHRDFRRRYSFRLVVRAASTAGDQAGGMQSAQECPVEGGQQERHRGCAQAGRVAARRAAVAGLPRRRTARRR